MTGLDISMHPTRTDLRMGRIDTTRRKIFDLCSRLVDYYTIAAASKVVIQAVSATGLKNKIRNTSVMRIHDGERTLIARSSVASKGYLRT